MKFGIKWKDKNVLELLNWFKYRNIILMQTQFFVSLKCFK